MQELAKVIVHDLLAEPFVLYKLEAEVLAGVEKPENDGLGGFGVARGADCVDRVADVSIAKELQLDLVAV